MNRYKDIMGRINYGLFLAVVALLPFPQAPLRLACVLWIVSWLLEGRWLSCPKSLKANKMAIPFVLFGIWYAWRILSGLWAADHAAWAFQMECYMTFGLLVPVGIWGVNERYDLKQIGKVFVISCVAAIPIYIAILSVLRTHREIIDALQWKAVWDYSRTDWWVFMCNNISVFKHRLFLCSVQLFAAVIAWQIWRKQWLKLIPIWLVLLSAIPLTGSRQSILSACALAVMLVVLELPKRLRVRYGALVLLVGVGLSIGLLKVHPRMQHFDIKDITELRAPSPDHDVRFNIWGVALQHPSDYIVHGLGAGQSRQYMLSFYEQFGFSHYYEEAYNSHNQYLEETIELGIFGALFFVLIWLFLPLCAEKEGRRTAILLTTLYMMNMCTDCMFGRFCGIALWAVALIIILLQSNPQRQQESTGDTETH